MLTLYLAPGSSSMAPHIALREAGADFEIRVVSFARREQHSPAYLAINPEGKVPALVIDGRTLTEVAAILYYIARRYPQAALLPEGVESEARVIAWMSFLASSVHPARARGQDAARAAWALVEKRLAGRDWAVGDRFSIADIHLFRLFWRTRGVLGDDVESAFPAVSRHYARMMARPAVIETCQVEAGFGYELPA